METLTLEQFTALCDSMNGIFEIQPHCGGSNACRGMSYDTGTQTLTEHTCRGTNTCAGYSCVDLRLSARRVTRRSACPPRSRAARCARATRASSRAAPRAPRACTRARAAPSARRPGARASSARSSASRASSGSSRRARRRSRSERPRAAAPASGGSATRVSRASPACSCAELEQRPVLLDDRHRGRAHEARVEQARRVLGRRAERRHRGRAEHFAPRGVDPRGLDEGLAIGVAPRRRARLRNEASKPSATPSMSQPRGGCASRKRAACALNAQCPRAGA